MFKKMEKEEAGLKEIELNTERDDYYEHVIIIRKELHHYRKGKPFYLGDNQGPLIVHETVRKKKCYCAYRSQLELKCYSFVIKGVKFILDIWEILIK